MDRLCDLTKVAPMRVVDTCSQILKLIPQREQIRDVGDLLGGLCVVVGKLGRSGGPSLITKVLVTHPLRIAILAVMPAFVWKDWAI